MNNDLLSAAEAAYKWKKLSNKLNRAESVLNTDWKKINTERETLELPKITNESQRKAHLDLKMKDDMAKELELELAYNSLLREYQEQRFKEVAKDES